MIEQLLENLKNHPHVEAILLGGSRGRGVYDDQSDYDMYIYLSHPINEQSRRHLIDPFVSSMEYSNHFWELEDDGILKNGIEIELIYRDTKSMFHMMDEVISLNRLSHGYTTCFIENFVSSKILYDRTNSFEDKQKSYQTIFTFEFKKAVISYNLPIIIDKMPALYHQVEKAVDRHDLHAINHRLTEYFNIYYDILFTLNDTLHPGEKRLLSFHKTLKKQPKDAILHIESIFFHMYHNSQEMLIHLKTLSHNLELLCEEEKIK